MEGSVTRVFEHPSLGQSPEEHERLKRQVVLRRQAGRARSALAVDQGESDPVDHERVRAKSVQRARRRVRHAVKQMRATHMLTLTYRENMQDPERLRRDWDRFVRRVRAKYPDWQYVCVREKQERGAWHFHIALRGFQNVLFLRHEWRAVCGDGNIHVRGPSKRRGWKMGAAARMAGYMSKYLGKQFADTCEYERRYWVSQGIGAPDVETFYVESSFSDLVTRCMLTWLQDGRSHQHATGDEGYFFWAAVGPPLGVLPESSDAA